MGVTTAIRGTISVVALVIAACSPTADATTTTSEAVATSTNVTPTTTLGPASTTEPPTTTQAPATTTTTTVPPLIISDAINGLPVDDPTSTDRRVVAIKIDNHQSARPQSGLMEADMVYEILVEGGYTRFIAMFHQSDHDWVGPVRSGRPTDINVIKPLDGPFQISGAQKYVTRMFRDEGLRMVYDNGITTWREHHRKAPHNLYSSSLLIRDWADAKDWPDENPGNMFTFGEPATSSDRAHIVTFDWSNQPSVIWKWTQSGYTRFNENEPHLWVSEEGDLGHLTFPTLLAIKGRKYTVSPPTTTTTSSTTTTTLEGTEPTPPPAEPSQPTSVPAIDLVGTGEAILFHDGTAVEGTWSKESKSASFEFVLEDGSVMMLPPSKIWVSIFPSNREITWE
jgi:hypothetical protein